MHMLRPCMGTTLVPTFTSRLITECKAVKAKPLRVSDGEDRNRNRWLSGLGPPEEGELGRPYALFLRPLTLLNIRRLVNF